MNLFCKRFCYLSLFGIMIFSMSGIAFSWDYFHNDIARTGYVDRIAPAIPELDWKYDAGNPIFSSPVVNINGTIFICSHDGILHALYPDGRVKWTFEAEGPIESTPALDPSGVLYFGDLTGRLYAIDINNSNRLNVVLLWTFPAETGKNIGAIYSSPIVDGQGRVIFGSDDQNLYCLLPTGTVAWPPFSTKDKIRSSPVIDTEGNYYIASYDGYLYVIDSYDGDKLWDIYLGFPIHSTPALSDDGIMHVCTKNGLLYFIDISTGTFSSPLYRTQGFLNRLANRGITSSPAITPDGYVYFGGLDRFFYSVTPNSLTNFIFPLPDKITSSPALASNRTVIFGDENGNIIALDSQTGNWKWAYDLDEYPVISSPAIGYEEYYVDSNGNGAYDRGEDYYDQNNDNQWNPPSVYIATEGGVLYALKDGENNQPVITDVGVTPEKANYFTSFRYHFRYDDPDSNPAMIAQVYINGVSHQMSCYGTDPAHGVYEYETKLAVGTDHIYYFIVGDGISPNLRLPKDGWYNGPDVTSVNLPSVLKSGKVDPAFGDLDTGFNFYVDWNDTDTVDTNVPVSLMMKSPGKDWAAYKMTSQGTSTINYGFRTYAKLGLQLPQVGEHQFYFIVTDTAYNTTKYPETGYLTGPSVRLSGGSPWSMRQQNSAGRSRSDYRGPDVPVVYWKYSSVGSGTGPTQTATPTPTTPEPTLTITQTGSGVDTPTLTPTETPTDTGSPQPQRQIDVRHTQITTSGTGPLGRTRAKMYIDPQNFEAIITCGNAGFLQPRQDTYVLNLASNQWTSLGIVGAPPNGGGDGAADTATSASVGPAKAIWYMDRGGATGTTYANMKVFDVSSRLWSSWSSASEQSGNIPPHINGAAAWDSQRNRLLYTGGAQWTPLGMTYNNDTYAFEPGTNTWTRLATLNDPPGRMNFCTIYRASTDDLVIYGGTDNNGMLGDVWSLDLGTNTWTQLPTPRQVTRENATAVYDPNNDMMIVFGGNTGNGLTWQTEAYDFASSRWATPTWMGPWPSARKDSASAFNATAITPYMLIFGGEADGTPLFDVWRLDITVSTRSSTVSEKGSLKDSISGSNTGFNVMVKAEKVADFKEEPSRMPQSGGETVIINSKQIAAGSLGGPAGSGDPRMMCNPDKNQVYVASSGFTSSTFTFLLNVLTESWTDLGIPVTDIPEFFEECPSAEDQDHQKLYYIARSTTGFPGGGVAYEATYVFDGNTRRWSRLNTSGEPPIAVLGAAAYDSRSNRLLFFGGNYWDDNTGSMVYLNDTYSMDISSNTWSRLTTSNNPPGRRTRCAIYRSESNSFVIFGGLMDTGVTGEAYSLDLNTNTWTRLPDAPTPREQCSAVYDSSGDRMITFGGFKSNMTQTDAIEVFDFASNSWINVTVNGTRPSPRVRGGVVFNSRARPSYMIVFGGQDASSGLNDVYKLEFPASAKIHTSPIIDEYGNVFIVDEDGIVSSVKAAIPTQGNHVNWSRSMNTNVYSTLALSGDGNYLYFGSIDHDFYSLNRADGSVRWAYDTGGRIYSSPTIGTSGNIYFGNEARKLFALQDVGGSPVLLWTYQANNAINSSPAVYAKDGVDYIIFTSVDGQIYCVRNYNNDYPILEWVSVIKNVLNSTPVISDDLATLYIGSNNRYLYAIDTKNGLEKWRFLAKGIFSSSVAISQDGTIYAGCEDGSLYAINSINGRQKWSLPTYVTNPDTGKEVLSKITVTPAVDADGKIYFGSQNGFFYCLDSEGKEIWKYSTGKIDRSSASIDSEGRVFVGTSLDTGMNYLYAFNGEDPNPPVILKAGFDNNVIQSSTGGNLLMRAHMLDPENLPYYIELYDNYKTTPEDTILLDRGSYPDVAVDDYYTTLIHLPAGMKRGEYAYQLVGLDTSLNRSIKWPYLQIKDIIVNPDTEPTPTPTDDPSIPHSAPFFGSEIYQTGENYTINVGSGLQANFTRVGDVRQKAPQGLGNPPRVIYGGFDYTDLNSTSGGTLHVLATARDMDGIGDITEVRIIIFYLGIQDMGGVMTETGRWSDGFTADYEFTLQLNGGLPPGMYINHSIVALDTTNQAGQWPLVIVE